MNLSSLCRAVTDAPYGSRLSLIPADIESTPKLYVFPQSLPEKIFRVFERVVHTLFLRFQSSAIFDSKRIAHVAAHKPTLLNYFEGLFGQDRVQRALKDSGLSYTQYQNNKKIFSKEDIQILFSRFLLLKEEDYNTLLQEIHGKRAARTSIQPKIEELRKAFAGISSLDECSKKQMTALEEILLPFSSLDEAFLGNIPSENYVPLIRLSREFLLRHTAYCIEGLRRSSLSNDDWEVYVAKRITPPDLPEGIILHHPEGCLELTHTIDKSGAHKSFFQAKGKGNTALHNYVFFRGTRGAMATDSMKNILATLSEDITDELGASGAIHTYTETKRLIQKLRNNGRNIAFTGYSLGGAHAQRDAILFHDQIDRLVTVSSPGIEAKTAHIAVEEDRRSRLKLKKVVHNIDKHDLVSEMGEALLGAAPLEYRSRLPFHVHIRAHTIATTSCDISQKQNKAVKWPIKNSFTDIFQLGMTSIFFTCIRSMLAHLRAPSIQPHAPQPNVVEFSSLRQDESQHVHAIVNRDPTYIDPRFEQVRRMASIFRSPGFSQFVRSQRELA